MAERSELNEAPARDQRPGDAAGGLVGMLRMAQRLDDKIRS
jgi:hypothetical protein